nr:transporter [uncultured Tolumonas sp.]
MKSFNKSALQQLVTLGFVIVGYSASIPMCSAAEGISPLQPGATTGTPAGALPPAGLYFMADTDYENGKLKNNEGNTALTPDGKQIKASNVSAVVALTWVTDKELFGARYAAAIAQPYKWANTEFTTSSGTSTVDSQGMVNTAITPVILSWDLKNGYFISTGLTVFADNGDFSADYDATAGRNVKNATTIGNDYWTFEPSFAVTHMGKQWAVTFNNMLDYNTTNHTTDYRSGMTYYLDASATRHIDKFTVGLIGNYTKQITDDEVNGVSVAAVDGLFGTGNRSEHVLAGPLLGYDFGSFSLISRLLVSLRAKNDADVSFVHLGVSVPLH